MSERRSAARRVAEQGAASFATPVRVRWDKDEEEWDLIDGDNLWLLSVKEWRVEYDAEKALRYIARAINAYTARPGETALRAPDHGGER